MKRIERIDFIEDFFRQIEKKKCICFGAGRKLDEICRDIPQLAKEITYVIDNNSKLHGTKREVAGQVKKCFCRRSSMRRMLPKRCLSSHVPINRRFLNSWNR